MVVLRYPAAKSTLLALGDGPSLGGGHGEISLTDFELLGLKEPPSQTNFPAHLAADRATGEVLHDLAIVRTRLRFRSSSFLTTVASCHRLGLTEKGRNQTEEDYRDPHPPS